MSEKVAAICNNCSQATTGKIYEPGWCADCKIKDLEDSVQFYKEQYEYTENDRSKWVKKYNDESSQKIKYKHAFEVLFAEIRKK